MPVGCYKQMSAIKEGVIMRLQCTYYFLTYSIRFDRDTEPSSLWGSTSALFWLNI